MDTDVSVPPNLLYVRRQQHQQEHYQCRSAQKAADGEMGDMTPFSQPLPSALGLARPWLLFLRLLDLDKGPRGRARHTTLAHMGGMCTQNILEDPKMECFVGLARVSLLGLRWIKATTMSNFPTVPM